jgi:uridine kinase
MQTITERPDEPILVTLTGGAGAGKTTLAEALRTDPHRRTPVRVLHGDDYYFPSPSHGGSWAPDENGIPRLDVGDPASMDLTRLTADTDSALTGGGESGSGSTPRLVIVDGMFARCIAPDTPCRRLDVFLDLPADLRLARKIQRKCLSEDFPLDILLRNYLTHRRAAHIRHIEPARTTCDLVLDGTADPEALVDTILARLADPVAGRGRS